MYKEVLSKIEGISIYPVISFVVFFAFFIIMTSWVIRSKKTDFEIVSNIPFSEEKK
jgi:hypothetical protein